MPGRRRAHHQPRNRAHELSDPSRAAYAAPADGRPAPGAGDGHDTAPAPSVSAPHTRPCGTAATMGSVYRFLLTPRWLGFAALIVLLAAVMAGLGDWQLH